MLASMDNWKERINSPLNYGSRIDVQLDPKTQFESELSYFLQQSAKFEVDSKVAIYEAENMDLMDARLHCIWLCRLIGSGQTLFLFGIENSLHEQGLTLQMQLLDKKIQEYIHRMHEWHDSIGATDEPESFKQAMKDLKEGKVLPLKVA